MEPFKFGEIVRLLIVVNQFEFSHFDRWVDRWVRWVFSVMIFPSGLFFSKAQSPLPFRLQTASLKDWLLFPFLR